MKTRVVRQAISEDCLFRVIAEWCKSGAGRTNRQLHMLSAFASGAGIAALSPLFDIFLARGNCIDIICGIDRNGTDKEAIRRLHGLLSTHHSGINVSIFHAPSKNAIFHPKLYICESPKSIDFVIGSGNMTSSGLGSNFESLLLYEKVPKTSAEAKHALSIWNTFAHPVPPLRQEYLRPLSRAEHDRLMKRLPKRSHWESSTSKQGVTDLWKPLSRVKLPHSERVQHRQPPDMGKLESDYLLMDILTETRRTQMQIPLPVVEGFFRIKRRQPAEITVMLWSPDGFTQPIKRPILILTPTPNNTMRRLEMPQIRDLPRSLAVLFVKVRGHRRFAYRILPQGTGALRTANSLLNEHGQQGLAERRYIIGKKDDELWPKVQKLLPT